MASEIKVDTISEKTSANGVAIDSLGIKDGKITNLMNATLSAADLGVGLHIKTSDTSATVNNDGDELVIENGGSGLSGGMTILSATNGYGSICFGDSGDDNIGIVRYDHNNNSLDFFTNASERMMIADDGDIFIAKTSANDAAVGIQLHSSGRASFTRSAGIPIIINREDGDGDVVQFQVDNGIKGTISISGSTVSYNAFSGSHWSRLADNSKPTILRGTVMESIATMCDWYQAVADDGEVKESINLPNGKSVGDAVTFTSNGKEYTGKYVKEENERLPMCKISDTEDSKNVYGVFMAWDDKDDGLDGDVNDMYVTSLGAFVVRIHKDETVAIGDYLQSKGDGTAKKQADDILRASTIAKVTSTEKTHTHADGSYCVPCTLHCG
jgi:hypothetical protein